jgi:hypothetical protein
MGADPTEGDHMPPRRFEIEEIMDSLATVSEILFRRLKCMECNQCEPCGPVFMGALNVLREAGEVKGLEAGRSAES